MKKYVLEFIRRGLIACGFGPLVLAVLYLILQKEANLETLTVNQVCLGILSLSALAKCYHKIQNEKERQKFGLLMLSQFLHLFSLNEIVDVSKIYAAELSRVRGITPANLNTFSNANRTRDPKVMQTFFWTVYDIFRNEEPDFIRGRPQ